MEESYVTPIGITNWRNQNKHFGIWQQDRFGHIYCIGKTGTGKSTLLESMAISDIKQGNGFCVIDPHGDIAESILNYIPKERIKDVLYFNPQDEQNPIGINPLQSIPERHHHMIASGLITVFKKIWNESWGPRLEYILRNSILTLLEYPDATLLDIQPLLTDYYFRNKVLSYTANTAIITFWSNEFNKYPPNLLSEIISPILNKVGIFSSNLLLRNIVGQKNQSINFSHIMNNKQILICNLAKGTIGEDVSALLGNIIVTFIQLEALARSVQSEEDRIPFYLYVDEMHSFISLSFVDILSEARKYKLSLFLTHQYVDQIDPRIRSAIFGNIGTLIVFRVGADDAFYLANEFKPIFSIDDLIAQKQYCMYIKLMINGVTSKAFSAKTIPLSPPSISFKGFIIEHSRKIFSLPKDTIVKQLESKNYGGKEPPKLFN